MVSARPAAAAHAARGYRLRIRAGVHDVRSHRSEVLDLQRRDPAEQATAGYGSSEDLRSYYPCNPRLTTPGVDTDVNAKESEVPQATARSHEREGLAGLVARVRRLRLENAGCGLDHGPADRSRPYRDYPFREARRQSLDSHLSGQAGHEEACGNPNGQR